LFPNGHEDAKLDLSFFYNDPFELAKLQDKPRKDAEALLKSKCGASLPSSKGLYVVLPGAHCVPSPPQEAFTNGALESTPAWRVAEALREELLDELAGFTVRATLTPQDRRTYDSLELLRRQLAAL
jgi:hypothetical protein